MSKDKIIELNEQGKTVTDIAKELNVSKAHVSQTLKRNRDKHPTSEPQPIPPSVPEPASKIQEPDQGPAATEEKEPEPPKPKVKKEPKPETPKYTPNKLKAIVMKEIADHPKKWEKYLKVLPHVWGGTLKGGSGWSTAWLGLFDILADGLNETL
jgi:transposase-like protein